MAAISSTPFGMTDGSFCGEPLMKDGSIYNSSSIPNVSQCFQHTILVFVPSLFFWVLFPAFLLQSRRLQQSRRFLPLPWSPLFVIKGVIALILFCDAIFIFSRHFVDSDNSPSVNWVYPIILALTAAGLFCCHIIAKYVGIVSSGIIFNTYLVFTIAGVPELYEWIQRSTDDTIPSSNGRALGFYIWWSLCLLQTALYCFADKRSEKQPANYELDSSFLNRLTLWWFTPLPLTGARRDLEFTDCFELNEGNQSHFLKEQWEYYWNPTIEKYFEKKKLLVAESTSHKLLNGNSNDFVEENVPKEKEAATKKLEPPSVIYNLFKMFKFEFFAAMIIKGFADVLQFANPYLLQALINYVSDADAKMWQGLSYALLMFGASQLRSFLVNYYFYIMFRMGIKLQSAMTGAVYRKTLRLSNGARRDKTVGEIVNLMAIDIERFQLVTSQIQQYWSSPFQICLALIFLFNTLGIAALPGVLITALFIPYNIFTSFFMRRWMITQMKLKDERAKMCNEVLNGIKVIKLYAWEIPMMNLIENIRKRELSCIFKSSLVRISVDIFNWATPFLVALFAFMTYTLTDPENHKLTPAVAFVSLTLFNQLRSPMTMLGLLINITIETMVSNKRLKNFMIAEELDEKAIDRTPQTSGKYELIEAHKADFSWETPIDTSADSSHSSSSLRDISLSINRGDLIAIVGRVGAGKSSLLSALLGEMEKLRGEVSVRGQIAYVPQQAWIQNMTLRDNICFGQPYNKTLYNKVIDACALRPDLEILPDGDLTEIGEKGINLSGGQKARISLARAIYQNCDIYFFDDPLSAVDSHVGKHIFINALGPRGLLKNKTRILVTHGVTFLPNADKIIVMDKGEIYEQGEYDELIKQNGKLAEVVAVANEEGGTPSQSSKNPSPKPIKKSLETFDEEDTDEYDEPELSVVGDADINLADISVERKLSTISVLAKSGVTRRHSSIRSSTSSIKKGTMKSEGPEKLIQKEKVESRRVKVTVYMEYIKAAGYFMMSAYIFFYIAYQAVMSGRNFWLSQWADDNDPSSATQPTMSSNHRLAIYAVLGGCETIAMALGLICLAFGGLKASKNLHSPVLIQILRSPMSFFDTTPVGRILNRLSKDIEVVDMRLPMNFRYFAMCLTQVAFTLLIICITTPIFTAVIIPLAAVYVLSLRYYVPTSRQLKRLESNSRSPIYSHFGETIQGAAVIRAFRKSEKFSSNMDQYVDKFCQVKYMNLISNRWLAVRLEFIGNLVVFFAALFAVLSHYWGWISSPGLVGLSVSYALNITEVLNFAVRQVSELETNIVSVERLKEYTEVESEAPWRIEGKSPPDGWPQQGRIEFRGYSTRYRTGLELVVRNINAFVKPGEKIGIVGRTGAGKSSLTLALFRMIEAAEGKIVIDSTVIAEIGLHDLRSNITIIPQDPVCFSASLRFNLDPFNKYSDTEIWTALEMAHLKAFVASLPEGLSHQITEGGENVSVGQRQLLCLARALLRRSKILVLDEATAAVDLATDALIQDTIRKEFKDSTIFTIAHRLNTIMDYDRVMVLDKGEIKEMDSPQKLLENKNSYFSAMVLDSKNTESNNETKPSE
jgi:multidrug resistance-associated protein (MRP)